MAVKQQVYIRTANTFALSIVDNSISCRGRQGGGSPEVHRDEVPDRIRVKGECRCCYNTSWIHKKEQAVIQNVDHAHGGPELGVPCMCHNFRQVDCLSHHVKPGSRQSDYSVLPLQPQQPFHKQVFCYLKIYGKTKLMNWNSENKYLKDKNKSVFMFFLWN